MALGGNQKYFGLPTDENSPFLENENFDNLDAASAEASSGSPKCKKQTSHRKIISLGIIGVSLLVVVVVCVVVTTQRNDRIKRDARTSAADRKFSLDDIFSGKYKYDTFEADWDSDSTYIHNDNQAVVQVNVNTGANTILMSPDETKRSGNINIKDLSPDKKWFMYANNTNQLYRHSFYADYYLKNMETGKIFKLRTPNDDEEQIRYCGWTTVANAIVFVHKCNIYYMPSADVHKYYLITGNGVPKKVFNGVPDWVYEEEIISSTHAIEFSDDGRYMAYVMFNATLVPFYRFPKYGDQDQMYPTIEKIAYPKAGFPNPTIQVTVVDMQQILLANMTESRTHIIPPKEISKTEYYYSVMKFNKNGQLFIQWMNRAQNKTMCVVYGIADPKGFIVEHYETPNGWIDDDYVKPKFAKNGSYYLTMLPNNYASKGAFRHLAKVSIDFPNSNMVDYLTEGGFTVQDIRCYNPEEEIVYFRSTEESPKYRHVYSINILTRQKKCITCGLVKDSDGTECTYFYPSFSKSCTWVILLCQGPFVPKTVLYNLKTGVLLDLVSNNKTRENLKSKDVPLSVYYTIKSDGFDIPVKETRPVDFNPNRKYAVLMDVYGGPNSQKILDRYFLHFTNFFVSGHNIIVVNFDARGAGGYGYKFLYSVYRNLGYYEAIDANNVAKYLQKQSYVDPQRIAIWGWSYGGFYSAATLAMPDGVINTAVSVAPVTDWRYYDTVYSERYMGFPSKEDNLAGYQRTSIMSKAKNFHGKNFLLIHGTADDNVHFQNSAQLAAALIKQEVKFSSQFYTDRDHSIESQNHVYYMITDYLLEHLTGKGLRSNTTFGSKEER